MDSTDTTELELGPKVPRRGILGLLTRTWRLARAVFVGFRGEPIGLRAGNLTFVTVTSLVPLAVVILSLVHQFGATRLDRLVKAFFAELLSPGGEQTVRAFFSATNVGVAGGVSFLVVMVSAGVLLRHLDASLNDVWAVRRKRPVVVSVGLYAGILLFGPLIMVLSLLGSSMWCSGSRCPCLAGPLSSERWRQPASSSRSCTSSPRTHRWGGGAPSLVAWQVRWLGSWRGTSTEASPASS